MAEGLADAVRGYDFLRLLFGNTEEALVAMRDGNGVCKHGQQLDLCRAQGRGGAARHHQTPLRFVFHETRDCEFPAGALPQGAVLDAGVALRMFEVSQIIRQAGLHDVRYNVLAGIEFGVVGQRLRRIFRKAEVPVFAAGLR